MNKNGSLGSVPEKQGNGSAAGHFAGQQSRPPVYSESGLRFTCVRPECSSGGRARPYKVRLSTLMNGGTDGFILSYVYQGMCKAHKKTLLFL